MWPVWKTVRGAHLHKLWTTEKKWTRPHISHNLPTKQPWQLSAFEALQTSSTSHQKRHAIRTPQQSCLRKSRLFDFFIIRRSRRTIMKKDDSWDGAWNAHQCWALRWLKVHGKKQEESYKIHYSRIRKEDICEEVLNALRCSCFRLWPTLKTTKTVRMQKKSILHCHFLRRLCTFLHHL